MGVIMTKANLVLLIILFTLSSTNLFAQDALKKGSYSLSGSVSFSSGKSESLNIESDHLTFMLSPGITYFFMDNISAGIDVTYGYSELTWNDGAQESKNIIRPISIGPIFRFYFSTTTFIPFIEAGYQYSNTISGNNDSNSYFFAGGINYFLSNSVALEPYVKYSKIHQLVGDHKSSSVLIGMRINYFIVN